MDPRTPTRRQPGKPYRVMYSLLYARFDWVTRRPDGAICADAAKYAQMLGLRTRALHEALCTLKDRGDLERLIWHHTWFLALPRVPPGLTRHVGPVLDAETLEIVSQ